MAKCSLKPPFDELEADIIKTILAGHKEWRPDLSYPESHSDMQGGIRALLKKYNIVPRDIPLDWKDIEARCSRYINRGDAKCKECGDHFREHSRYVQDEYARYSQSTST